MYSRESAARPVLQCSAGGLVVDPEGRVLMIRARDLRERPVWTLPEGTLGPGETPAGAAPRGGRGGRGGPLPKGTRAPGETPADAALREVREETGGRCGLVRELETVSYWFQRDGRRVRKTVHWFLMRPVAKVGEHDHEGDEVRWAGRGGARGGGGGEPVRARAPPPPQRPPARRRPRVGADHEAVRVPQEERAPRGVERAARRHVGPVRELDPEPRGAVEQPAHAGRRRRHPRVRPQDPDARGEGQP